MNMKIKKNYVLLSFALIFVVSLITQTFYSMDLVSLIEIEEESEISKIEEIRENKSLDGIQFVTTQDRFSLSAAFNPTLVSIKRIFYTSHKEINFWKELNNSPPVFLS